MSHLNDAMIHGIKRKGNLSIYLSMKNIKSRMTTERQRPRLRKRNYKFFELSV